MVKGLQGAVGILLFLFLPGVIGSAEAQKSTVTTRQNQSSCQLSSFFLVSCLKNARLTSDHYVPAIFTSVKEPNGSFTASIGAGVVAAEAVESSANPIAPIVPSIGPSEIPQPVQATKGGLRAEVLFAMVNDHRARIGLPPFQQDGDLSQIAQSRTPELQGEMYNGGGMHAGFYNRQLPYRATENMISQQTEAEALNWWLNSSVHRKAIEGDYTHASVACEGKNCAMIFTSFQPK